MTSEQKPTLEQLKAKLAEALATGNDNDFMVIVGQIAKAKAEIAKAQAEVLKKEAEAMAGDRAKLAEKILNQVRKAIPNLDEVLAKVKATGFSFYLPEGEILNHRVALKVPEIKAKRTSTGGGSSGTSEKEFGMKLDAIYEKFKTPEDDAKMEEAKNAEANSNSKQWQVKVAVKKRALASGELKAVS